MRVRGFLLVVVVAGLVSLVACGGGTGKEPPITSSPARGAEPTPWPTPPPQPTVDCPRTWELCGDPPIDTAAGLETYIANQRSLLATMASSTPDRLARAGVNLKRLLTQPELDALFAKYGLEWGNIYWEAPNDVHGAISSGAPYNSLPAMEEKLRSEGHLGPNEKITGGFYFSVHETPLATLADLDRESDVQLVDIGSLDEFDAAVAELTRLNVYPMGACLSFCLRPPLRYAPF